MKRVIKFSLLFSVLFLLNFLPSKTALAAEVIGTYTLSNNVTLFNEPTFTSQKNGALAPQTVNILEKTDNGWMKIDTYLGDKWIAPKGESYQLIESATLYSKPSLLSSTSGSLSPQPLTVLDEQADGWLKVRTYLGDKWISPEGSELTEENEQPIINGVKNIVAGVSNLDKIRVKVDGRTVAFPDTKPFEKNNRVFVPIRFVSQEMGYTVNYSATTKRVVIENLNSSTPKRVTLTIGSKTTTITNLKTGAKTTKILDVAPIENNGRTMVPIRFISESLGAKVKWQKSSSTVEIINKGLSKIVYQGLRTYIYLNNDDVKAFYKIAENQKMILDVTSKIGNKKHPYVAAIIKGGAQVVKTSTSAYMGGVKLVDKGRGVKVSVFRGAIPYWFVSQ